jgi:Fe(3+) dicitrate transport protein
VVSTGDRVPYIPQNQWTLTARLEHKKYELNLSSRFNAAFNTQAANGNESTVEQVPSNFILDLSAKYHLSKHLRLTAQIVNLLDEVYLVSRVPAGFRPGHPLGIYTGLQFDL